MLPHHSYEIKASENQFPGLSRRARSFIPPVPTVVHQHQSGYLHGGGVLVRDLPAPPIPSYGYANPPPTFHPFANLCAQPSANFHSTMQGDPTNYLSLPLLQHHQLIPGQFFQHPMPPLVTYPPQFIHQASRAIFPEHHHTSWPHIAATSEHPAHKNFTLAPSPVFRSETAAFHSPGIDNQLQDQVMPLDDGAQAPNVAHSGSSETITNAWTFMEAFKAQFGADSAAVTSFQAQAKAFNNQQIDAIEFYKSVYKILFHGNALCLLPDFINFMPPTWNPEDLGPINKHARSELEMGMGMEIEPHLSIEGDEGITEQQLGIFTFDEAKNLDEPLNPSRLQIPDDVPNHDIVDEVQQSENRTGEVSPRNLQALLQHSKKSSVNSLTTATDTKFKRIKDKRMAKRVFAGPDEPPVDLSPTLEPSIPEHTQFMLTKSIPSTKVTRKRRRGKSVDNSEALANQANSQLVKKSSKIQKTKTTSNNAEVVVEETGNDIDECGAESAKAAGLEDNFATKSNYSELSASSVSHVGPVYRTRRAILARTFKPYIHGLCGARFMHPDDVRSHHRRICKRNSGNKGWNDHPSCKISFTQVNTAKCKDGFVVLDQESWDMIHECIREGLRDVGEDLDVVEEDANDGNDVQSADGNENGDRKEEDEDADGKADKMKV